MDLDYRNLFEQPIKKVIFELPNHWNSSRTQCENVPKLYEHFVDSIKLAKFNCVEGIDGLRQLSVERFEEYVLAYANNRRERRTRNVYNHRQRKRSVNNANNNEPIPSEVTVRAHRRQEIMRSKSTDQMCPSVDGSALSRPHHISMTSLPQIASNSQVFNETALFPSRSSSTFLSALSSGSTSSSSDFQLTEQILSNYECQRGQNPNNFEAWDQKTENDLLKGYIKELTKRIDMLKMENSTLKEKFAACKCCAHVEKDQWSEMIQGMESTSSDSNHQELIDGNGLLDISEYSHTLSSPMDDDAQDSTLKLE